MPVVGYDIKLCILLTLNMLNKNTIFTVRMFGIDRPEKNSVDPNQIPQNAACDQGLLCLLLIQQFLDSKHSSR